MGTYLVHVYDRKGRRECDKASFPIGQFKEIGYWLDYNGYIDSQFKVTIFITEG